MKDTLLEQIKKIDNGSQPLTELLNQQKELATLIFLTGFHSFMHSLNKINSTEFKEPLFLSLELTYGDYDVFIKPELSFKNSIGFPVGYTDDKERDSLISNFTRELNIKVSYIEAPNASNFSNEFKSCEIVIDLSDLDEINKLPSRVLSSQNNNLYSAAILDCELTEEIKTPNKKIKL